MTSVRYIDRTTREQKEEILYGPFWLRLLYGSSLASRILAPCLLPIIAASPWFSSLYGFFQKTRLSRYKIGPFINKFQVNTQEFLQPVETFRSFNDFFIRKLKPSCRPIAPRESTAILPADGRYLVFPRITPRDTFLVKGHPFCLKTLLQDEQLATSFHNGAMAIARLAPSDYHRFHFPCTGRAALARHIPGHLYSVNPLAIRKHPHILAQNKRMITEISTSHFGKVAMVEVGATNVGTIHQTFKPHATQVKGTEKGYFSFGGSCIILLFQSNTLDFEPDLVAASSRSLEVLGKMGEPLARARLLSF